MGPLMKGILCIRALQISPEVAGFSISASAAVQEKYTVAVRWLAPLPTSIPSASGSKIPRAFIK